MTIEMRSLKIDSKNPELEEERLQLEEDAWPAATASA
jgi:hypothetical protein